MKASKLTIVSIAIAIFSTSCTQSLPDRTGGASLKLCFDGFDEATKTQSNQESDVTHLQAAIYDSNGLLEWECSYDYAFSVAKTISGLEAGEKTVVAVANKKVTIPQHLDEFYRIPSSLSDNRRGSFVMVGSTVATADIKPGEAMVKLERIAAKISFRSSVVLNWNCTPPTDFGIEAVYVTNVGIDTDLSASGTAQPSLNPRAEGGLTQDENLLDLTCATFSSWKGSGDIFNNGVDFYVYPNSTQTRTTLIIKTRFDGHVSYYPLVIDQDIERNTQYRCGTITLTSDGMPSHADEFSSIKISYRYESEDWSEQNIGDAITF